MTERELKKAFEENRTLKRDKDAARKRTALRMLEEGSTLADAASAVHADERTVKRWREEAANESARMTKEHLADVLNARGHELPEATNEARQHIAALESDLEAHRTANAMAACAFCEWRQPVVAGGPARKEALRAHVATCQNHPMRALEQHVSDLEMSLKDVRADRDAAVAELAGMKARLVACEAELARLGPSGQVDGGAGALRAILFESDNVAWQNHDGIKDAQELVDRLVAKAQGYEAALSGCSGAKNGGAMCGHCSACVAYWETEASVQAENYERAKNEREAALSDLTRITTEAAGGSLAPDLYRTLGGRGAAEAMARALSERTLAMMVAVADNAALAALLKAAHSTWTASYDLNNAAHTASMLRARKALENGPHPGAALLDDHRKELTHARNEGLEKARKMVANVGLDNLASVIEAAREPEQ